MNEKKEMPMPGIQFSSDEIEKEKAKIGGILDLFDLGVDKKDMEDGYKPLVSGIGRQKTVNKKFPSTIFRFPLRTKRMKKYSSICKMSAAGDVEIDSIEEDLFEKFMQGYNALNRLLFVRSLLSVRIFVWDEKAKSPRKVFAIDIRNARQAALQAAGPEKCPIRIARLSLVTFLKAKMKNIGEARSLFCACKTLTSRVPPLAPRRDKTPKITRGRRKSYCVGQR